MYSTGDGGSGFRSKVSIGDDFVLENGFLEFDMLNSDSNGAVKLGIRLQRVLAKTDTTVYGSD